MLFLLFHLGDDRYALPARQVAEVLPLVSVKAIPGAPAGVAGVFDYRGTPTPVVDLSALVLGRPAARRRSTRVLIVHYPFPEGTPRRLGLIAERATEMLDRQPTDFEPATVWTEKARYLGPVTRDGRGLIQQVEVAELLTEELRAALFAEPEGRGA